MGVVELAVYLSLIVAIAVNCLSVYFQKRRGIYDRFKDHAHTVHAAIISIFWSIFILFYAYYELQLATDNFYQNTSIAIGFKVISVGMFVFALIQIGYGALTNKDMFTNKYRKLSGVYNYIKQPIYLSYTLFILSSAFLTGDRVFYCLSVISFIGLYIIESKIEALK